MTPAIRQRGKKGARGAMQARLRSVEEVWRGFVQAKGRRE
jgi:hypothetical protein